MTLVTPPSRWTCPFLEFGEVVKLPTGQYLPDGLRAVYWDERYPHLHIDLAMQLRDGVLVPVRWTLSSRDDHGVPPALLKRQEWQLIVERVVAKAAWQASSGERQEISDVDPALGYRAEAAALAGVGQRSVDTPLLRQVASIARANPATPAKAVAERMNTSRRNAGRWLAAARKAGLLIDATRSED